MEETKDKLPADYIQAFNTGYSYTKKFPEVAQSISEQNKSTDELSPVNGLLRGIEQGLKEGRDLVNERQSELDEIQKNNNLDIDIER